jgi:hypothetical protein
MTPQERKLLDELFDRLASLENDQRDPGAVDAINEGLKRAPNALYPLVQTALVQDEALKRAAARIHELEQELELEPGEPVQQPGFLDNMRDALIGRRESHGSVPSVRPGGAPAANSPWGNMGGQNPGGQSGAYAAQPQAQGYGAPPSGGGSFLGTAAATAAGVVGGALLMNSFRGMFGNAHAATAGAFDSAGSGSPWSTASNSDAARDAGINDIGSGRGGYGGDGSQRAGMVDTAQADADSDDDQDADDDDGDFDGGDDGGSDNA